MNNITWIFSGVGVFIIGLFLKLLFKKRKTQISQKLNSGHGSVNIQLSGESSYSNVGISSSELKGILDIFQANFYKLSENAYKVAFARAEEFSLKFISTLNNQNQNSLQNIQDPAIQYALFNSQKEYAKSGDTNLRDILITALIERTSIDKRSFNQLVLDEALGVIPKITTAQLDALTLIFLIKNSRALSVKDIDTLHYYVNDILLKFFKNISKDIYFYQHLVYAGCITINKSMIVNEWFDLELMFKKNYRGLFSKGFTIEKLESVFGKKEIFKEKLIPCYHDSSKIQFDILNETELKEYSETLKLEEEDYKNLSLLYTTTIMTNEEVKTYLMNINKSVPILYDVWNNSMIIHSTLTSVGLAIAQLNYKHKIDSDIDLSNWLKEN